MTPPLHSRTDLAAPDTTPPGLRAPETRVEGSLKVTGRAAYAADLRADGMLWAAVVTSPAPHATIVSVDTARARAVPGVSVVLTGADLRPARFGRRLLDRPVLAWDRVRFVGERVAAVAAETPEAAREAVRRIDVRYRELPAVLDAAEALTDAAAVLHEHPAEYPFIGRRRPPPAHPNLQSHVTKATGEADLEAVFGRADHVYEHTFTTPRQHSGHLEPRATLVDIGDDGVVHVVSTNKAPGALREQLSRATGVPVDRIDVRSGFIGGDFGGKGFSLDEFLCYFLARASRRPVKAVLTYAEDLAATNHRHAATITLRTGVAADGRLLAHSARFLFDGGAYAAAKPRPDLSLSGAWAALAPYRVDHARVDVKVAYTNTAAGGHMRAPGAVQSVFAVESHLDMIADSLGMDPVALRLRNAVRGADTGPMGQRYAEPRAVEVLDKLGEVAREGADALPPNRGRGVAVDVLHVGGGREACVPLRLRPDGTVEATTGTADQGGGADTVAGRVVAAVLSLDPSQVTVVRPDPATAPPSPDVGGSRVTNVLSRAAHAGAVLLKQRLELLACEVAGVPPGELTLSAGRFTRAGGGPDAGSLSELAPALLRAGAVEVEGFYDGGPPTGEEAGDWNFGGCMVEVEVDTETGEVVVRDAVLVVDVGAIINPLGHQGQVEGGFAFGLGAALTEQLTLEGGRVTAADLADYRIPAMPDMPPLRTVLLPTSVGPGAFGAKAVGELTNALVAPAVANAVARAVGARVTSLPLTGARVLEALRAGA